MLLGVVGWGKGGIVTHGDGLCASGISFPKPITSERSRESTQQTPTEEHLTDLTEHPTAALPKCQGHSLETGNVLTKCHVRVLGWAQEQKKGIGETNWGNSTHACSLVNNVVPVLIFNMENYPLVLRDMNIRWGWVKAYGNSPPSFQLFYKSKIM